MGKRLNGKVAIVFGAGGPPDEWSNGKATAVAYAREGAAVICVDRSAGAVEETVRVIRSFLVDGTVPNCLNVSNVRAARFQLVIRMLDRVGTLANVLSVIKRHGINIEEVTNTVFEGGDASSTKLRLLSRPSEVCLTEIRAFEEILHLDLVTLPNLA